MVGAGVPACSAGPGRSDAESAVRAGGDEESGREEPRDGAAALAGVGADGHGDLVQLAGAAHGPVR